MDLTTLRREEWPSLVMRIGPDHAKRLEKWLTEEYSDIVTVLGYKNDLMYLQLEDKTEAGVADFIKRFCGDQVVSVLPTLTRIFPTLSSIPSDTLLNILEQLPTQTTEHDSRNTTESRRSQLRPEQSIETQDTPESTGDDLGHVVEESALLSRPTFRLQGCPRNLEAKIGPMLASHIDFVPQFAECTHVLSFVADPQDEQVLHYSCFPKHVFQPYFDMKQRYDHRAAAQDKPVSRAYDKLKEALLRLKVNVSRWQKVVDVGASPGGWSQFLAESDVCRVIAVDPGKLTIPHTIWTPAAPTAEYPTGTVIHIPSRVELRLEDIAALGPYDAYVCDMNVEMSATMTCLQAILPSLLPGAPVVVTIKHAPRSRHVLSAVHRAKDCLRDLGLADVAHVHLFANKHQEFTLTARKPQ
eukprot:m.101919 g.101919  ORF g.101919 m.101919 type:complete len:412 (+) comp14993_c0_seq1:300-1535(+)